MEVSPLPFLNQDQDYFTNFHSLFPETEDIYSFFKKPKLETQLSPFIDQEDCFTNFYPLFLEMDENKNNPKPETPTQFPDFLSLDNELEHNNNVLMSDYFNFDTNSQDPLSEPENSPTYSNNFNFQSLAGSSGHIQFQSPVSNRSEPDQNRFKRPREEPESVPAQPAPQRRLWVKNRSNAWWESVNGPDFPESEFVKSFRMTPATFELICDELDAAVTKKDTMLRQAIPVRQRVAVCIYRLATGDPLRVVSKKFGLGISTCHKIVLDVCAAIKTVLMPKYLQFPEAEKLQKIKKEFNDISGIPNVVGTVYTTHIPIIAPKVSVSTYFNKKHTERNQKSSYSITVQGVVGPDGVLNDVCIGWPGSMSDDKILEKSALYQRGVKGGLKDMWIVGNSGYPLMDWMLVPYAHKNLTWAQHGLNEKVEMVQKVAKKAFGRLKGRWSCLQKRTEVKLQDLPAVLGACCVLHNICEMRGEGVEDGMFYEVFDDVEVAENGASPVAAVQSRDQIAHHLLHHCS